MKYLSFGRSCLVSCMKRNTWGCEAATYPFKVCSSNHYQNHVPMDMPKRSYSVYQVGDIAGMINYGIKSKMPYVFVHAQKKIVLSLLDALYEGGYIEYYHFVEHPKGKKVQKPILKIGLKRFQGRDIFNGLQVMSRPGRRVFKSADEIAQLKRKGIHTIISTQDGVLLDSQAIARHRGGEVLYSIHC